MALTFRLYALARKRLEEMLQNLSSQELYYIGGPDPLPSPLSHEEELALVARLPEDDGTVRATLIERNLRLVVFIARKFENTGIALEDLISIGTIGLIKAVNTFDPAKKIKLATYASRCIENEILMHFRRQKKSAGDLSLSDSIDVDKEGNSLSLMDVISVEDDMLEAVSRQDSCRRLRALLEECLTEREAEILRMRYGLGGRPPLTQREVAQRCGISRSYVSRIEKKALAKLKERLQD